MTRQHDSLLCEICGKRIRSLRRAQPFFTLPDGGISTAQYRAAMERVEDAGIDGIEFYADIVSLGWKEAGVAFTPVHKRCAVAMTEHIYGNDDERIDFDYINAKKLDFTGMIAWHNSMCAALDEEEGVDEDGNPIEQQS